MHLPHKIVNITVTVKPKFNVMFSNVMLYFALDFEPAQRSLVNYKNTVLYNMGPTEGQGARPNAKIWLGGLQCIEA